MRNFEYASPRSETEAVELLNDPDLPGKAADTAVLAGGTDMVSLLQHDLVSPRRVVDLKHVSTLFGVRPMDEGVAIGALTTLEDMAEHPLLAPYASLRQVIAAVHAIQIQSRGTLGGDLCHLPNCWFFRNGYGLLGYRDGKSLVETGDNRYHAIFGNRGPAEFVALRDLRRAAGVGARVRIIGPQPRHEEWLPLENFFTTPKVPTQGVTVLKPGQLLTHVWLPSAGDVQSASYEVLQLRGLDWPQAAAAACVEMESGFVREAPIVLGHVAPVPWVARSAGRLLAGQALNEETAEAAGDAAVEGATPLSGNAYKVQMTRAAVKRALLRAVGQWEESDR